MYGELFGLYIKPTAMLRKVFFSFLSNITEASKHVRSTRLNSKVHLVGEV